MADRVDPNERKVSSNKALLISVGEFSGLNLGGGRLCLGWVRVGLVPRDMERQLQLAAEEIASLKAEMLRVSNESKQRLEAAVGENMALKSQTSQITKESEGKLELALAENERLRALVERVSSGVR